MVGLAIHVSGADEIGRRYNLLGAHLEDASPVLAAIRERFIAAEKMTFESEGGASGHWAPLSAAYAVEKAHRYGDMPILQATGHLMRSLTDELDIDIVEPHMAIFGTGDPVGGYHQRGNARLPRRPPLDIGEAELDIWAALIAGYFVSMDDSAPMSEAAA